MLGKHSFFGYPTIPWIEGKEAEDMGISSVSGRGICVTCLEEAYEAARQLQNKYGDLNSLQLL